MREMNVLGRFDPALRSPTLKGFDMSKSWTCFHCDETFYNEVDARDHFGATECSTPACQVKVHERGLVKAYRQIEDELAQWKIECAEGQLDYYRTSSRLNQAVKSAEEAGYAQGLEDGRKLALNEAQ